MLRKIVCLVLPGTAPFEFGVVCEVFGIDRTATGGPGFEFHIATADPGPVPMSLGFPIHVANDLSVAADADDTDRQEEPRELPQPRSDHVDPSWASRTSTPSSTRASRMRSDTTHNLSARTSRRRASSASTNGPTTSAGSRSPCVAAPASATTMPRSTVRA